MGKRQVVDTHIHYWDPETLTYDWLDSVPAIARAHGPRELQAQETATQRFQLAKIVFMQADCRDDEVVREAQWVNALAASIEPRIEGIIACAPVDLGAAVRPTLAALAALPRVRGVRRLIQDRPPGYATTPEFIAGVRALPEFGFSFDLCLKHGQLAEVIALVRACPDVSFILDHIGKPDIAGQVHEPWRTHIGELAQFPNTVCKISGVATEADLDLWTAADLQPYIEHVIACFGEDRILYGGDWPVSLLAVDHWGHWIDTLDDLTPELGAEAKRKLFHDNAVRVYRL